MDKKSPKSGKFYLLLTSIIILSIFLLFFKVSELPHNLYVDEVAIGYNAYSILKSGTDEFNRPFPLTFKSFGDNKLPLYIYVTAVSESIFGKNSFAIRLPSVLAGIFSVIIFIYLLKILELSDSFSLLAGLLLAISPWHLQFGRAGFESNLNLMLIILGIYLFIKSAKENRYNLNLLSLFIFSLALYTYHSSLVLVPLLIFFLTQFYKRDLKKIYHLRKIITSVLFMIILIYPFTMNVIANRGIIRASTESFLKEIHPYKSDDDSTVIILAGNQFMRNYISYFSTDFLFFSGDQQGRHSVREMGMMYLWQLPFLILGIIYLLKNLSKVSKLILLFFIAFPIPAALASPNPHALRGLSPLIPLTYITALGVVKSVKLFSRSKTIIIISVSVIASLYMIYYLNIYYVHYRYRTAIDWAYPEHELAKYIALVAAKYSRIYITDKTKQSYIYILFYENMDSAKIYKADNNFYKKYITVGSPFKAKPKDKAIYIAPNWEKWPGKLIKTIYSNNGDPIYNIWEN